MRSVSNALVNVFIQIFAAFLGLAGGIAVGGGMVALFVVLDMLPRLAQITNSFHRVHWFEAAIITGALFFTVIDLWSIKLRYAGWLSPVIGLLDGVFVGLLAAALTEVLNVLPILAKRLGMSGILTFLLTAMVLGKIIGSWFDCFIYPH
ncbi:stage V sporulation protein AB [Paenibacillus profundus]|uniref:Stage V sporulation protein AB n=1 Tax=Paenibacillus profundus TaxID=1173085 RepID=A0ABS8YH13_9BACL|nr:MULTISPECIES: stage V sporulation protein AB [Paenibacillus]MCE5169650.1 stage V sporulation protein AB [Paenibacillus profundus]